MLTVGEIFKWYDWFRVYGSACESTIILKLKINFKKAHGMPMAVKAYAPGICSHHEKFRRIVWETGKSSH